MTSVLILSQIIKIKMKVQVSNVQGLWLYLSYVSSIIKQWEKNRRRKDKELWVWKLGVKEKDNKRSKQ